MNTYDFNNVIQRKQTSSVKWDSLKSVYGESDLLPMWVADMDFEPPQEVRTAIAERLNHGIFGYTYTPDSTAQSIQDWLSSRHGWQVNLSWIIYNSGVVPTIAACIAAYTKPGDKIMVQTPVYRPFFDLVEKNERTPIYAPLLLKENRFEIDFQDFEAHLQEGVKMFILCNPHNPGGRVWKQEELKKIAELCKQYHCLIVSDEIHSDLVYKPNTHIPIVSIDESYQDFIITCIAPSKTFNLAGLQASAVLIPNVQLRTKFQRTQQRQGFFHLNLFGTVSMEAAYRYGKQWLDELLEYLERNIKTAKGFIHEQLPQIKVMEPEGTYLLWLNCRALHLSDEEIRERLVVKGKLGLESGTKFGKGGEGFVRMNLACPRETVIEGLERLKKAFS